MSLSSCQASFAGYGWAHLQTGLIISQRLARELWNSQDDDTRWGGKKKNNNNKTENEDILMHVQHVTAAGAT